MLRLQERQELTKGSLRVAFVGGEGQGASKNGVTVAQDAVAPPSHPADQQECCGNDDQ